ncbi:hypothetical protein C8J56DRAFT_220667 [Mycena floridula]|nr:hypothetical protein C8J56DRAFT_220667 [Mycena floridula]
MNAQNNFYIRFFDLRLNSLGPNGKPLDGKYKLKVTVDGESNDGLQTTQSNKGHVVWSGEVQIPSSASKIVLTAIKIRKLHSNEEHLFTITAVDLLAQPSSTDVLFKSHVVQITLSFAINQPEDTQPPISLITIRMQLAEVPEFPKVLGKVVDVLSRVNSIAGPAIRLAPFAGEAVASIFTSAISHFSTHQARVGVLAELATDVAGSLAVLETIQSIGPEPSELLTSSLQGLLRVCGDCGDFIVEYSRRTTFEHLLCSALSQDVSSRIEILQKRLNQATTMLQTSLMVTNKIQLHLVHEDTAAIRAHLNHDTMNIMQSQLNPIHNAKCDTEEYPEDFPLCMAGTRATVITGATESILNSLEDKLMFWMTGVAGSGKTTLGHTIVAKLCSRGVIVASFFCKRDDVARRNPRNVIPTLAYQLALLIPEYRPHLHAALEINMQKQIPQPAHPAKQLSLMILGPLTAANLSNRRVVLYIDALDECDEKPCQLLVDALIDQLQDFPKHLVVILVSRRTRELHAKLSTVTTLLVDLDETLESLEMNRDIRALMKEKLLRVAAAYDDHDWPTDWQISELTMRARGLFIWATTVCNFIDQPSYHEVLADLLSNPHIAIGVEELYAHALDGEFTKKSAWESDYKTVMGVILCSRVPLSASAIAELLQKRINTVLGTLAILQPVMLWGSPIRLAHASLADYLLSERSGKFYVQPTYQHLGLARYCLKTLCSPKIFHFNLAVITDSSSSVGGLPDKAERRQALPEHAAYSCANWAAHLDLCESLEQAEKEMMANLLEEFFSCSFLFWLEALSLLEIVNEGVESLRILNVWLKTQSIPCKWASDAFTFLDTFRVPIAFSPAHIYLSALPFSPRASMVANHYRAEFSDACLPQVISGLADDWPQDSAAAFGLHPPPHVLFPGSNAYQSDTDNLIKYQKPCFAWSPDGKFLACGQETNFWLIALSEGEKPLITALFHEPGLSGLAFSIDSTRLLSFGGDVKRIWSTQSMELTEQMDTKLPAHEKTDAEGPRLSEDSRRPSRTSPEPEQPLLEGFVGDPDKDEELIFEYSIGWVIHQDRPTTLGWIPPQYCHVLYLDDVRYQESSNIMVISSTTEPLVVQYTSKFDSWNAIATARDPRHEDWTKAQGTATVTRLLSEPSEEYFSLSENRLTSRYQAVLVQMTFASHSEALLTAMNVTRVFGSTVQFFTEEPRVADPFVHVLLQPMPQAETDTAPIRHGAFNQVVEWAPFNHPSEADGTRHYHFSHRSSLGFWPLTVVFDTNKQVMQTDTPTSRHYWSDSDSEFSDNIDDLNRQHFGDQQPPSRRSSLSGRSRGSSRPPRRRRWSWMEEEDEGNDDKSVEVDQNS